MINREQKAEKKDDPKVETPPTASRAEPAPGPKGASVANAKEKEREKLRAAEEKRQREEEAEDGIRNAVPLRAPPFGKGTGDDPTWSNIDEFSGRMRELATNEFKLREAQNTVFRSTFDMQQVSHKPSIKSILARNAIGASSKYDFDRGDYTLDLMLWYGSFYGESSLGGPVYDTCKLLGGVKVDAETAQAWRKGIDDGTLSLTVWYRFLAVEQASWKDSRRWGNLEHSLVFRVEIVKFAAGSR